MHGILQARIWEWVAIPLSRDRMKGGQYWAKHPRENGVSGLGHTRFPSCVCGLSQQESASVARSLAVSYKLAVTGFLEVLLVYMRA